MRTDRRRFVAGAGASLSVLAMPRSIKAYEASGNASATAGAGTILVGVDYYPDQTPEELWAEDARMMAEMGLTVVRMAEFAWGLMEPVEGQFHFDWLRRSVDMLHKAGIQTILGTPSAAPPPWLTTKYPEVFEKNANGTMLGPEGRRFTCPTNKRYRDLSLKVATAMAKNFANTPGVVGWQTDNELTLGDSQRCYCMYCQAGFQEWLKAKYESLEKLNAAWGTVFWSQTYSDFKQIPVPLPSGGPPNPGMALDYDRYQSAANVGFLDVQLRMLRTECPKHFVTTNNVAAVDAIDGWDLYRNLDFASTDNYPGFIAVYAAQGGAAISIPLDQLASVVSWGLDMTRSAKDGKPFFVMEQQSGKAGQNFFSPQPEKGQLRLWTYQTVAHGAMGVNYFRWDTATFGAEEYWHGLLNHDRSRSAGYAEIAQTVKELKRLGTEALQAEYAADAALVFDYSSDWALGIQPGQPKLKYQSEMLTWYGVASAGGVLLDLVNGKKDLSKYKVVFAPTLYVLSDELAQHIERYVQGGGIFVAGCRLGVKTEQSQIVKTPPPGLLRQLMGVEVEDYVPLYSDTMAVRFTGALQGPEAKAEIWADVLRLQGAEVLATYSEGGYAGKPAITMHANGKGKAVYVGAHLEPAALARVLITIERMAGVKPGISAPQGVEVTRRRSGSTGWTYVLNHLGKEQSVSLNASYKDALTGAVAQGQIVLEPYGVRVLLQES